MIFDLFYDDLGARDAEGLAAMRNVLNCKQVVKDTRKNFYAADLFLDKVLDALLMEAAYNKFGVVTTSDTTVDTDKGIHKVKSIIFFCGYSVGNMLLFIM